MHIYLKFLCNINNWFSLKIVADINFNNTRAMQ